MAIQLVNLGDVNSGTGDSVRVAFQKVNDNFVEIYGNTAPTLFTYGALENIIGNHLSEFGSLVGNLPNSVNYSSLLSALTANTGTFKGFVNSLGLTAEYVNTGTSLSVAQLNHQVTILESKVSLVVTQDNKQASNTGSELAREKLRQDLTEAIQRNRDSIQSNREQISIHEEKIKQLQKENEQLKEQYMLYIQEETKYINRVKS